ncbi:MAG: CDP-diacylglycerol--glycerol-3-phosphate 3-phosphatidyltransferase [Pseudomonadota bacterium]|nr:CDP-diacylglycerol--glycerol-3-phosphate 3-phosphatidyltransferase [Pseudomonadota bacterium]
MNLANAITIFRLLLIPMVIGSYYSDWAFSNITAATLFTVASLSDWLDGYLARRLDIATNFGAFLDPVADKLLVTAVLIMLSAQFPVLLLPAMIIISREIVISALREWMASRGQREVVAVAYSGKLKTTFQMLSIIVLILVTDSSPDYLFLLGQGMIYLAAVLGLYSACQYLKAAIPSLSDS